MASITLPFETHLHSEHGLEYNIWCQSMRHVETLRDMWMQKGKDSEKRYRFLLEWKERTLREPLFRVLLYRPQKRDHQEKILHRRYYVEVQSVAWQLCYLWELYSGGTALIVAPGQTAPSRKWRKYVQPF